MSDAGPNENTEMNMGTAFDITEWPHEDAARELEDTLRESGELRES